MNLCQAGAKEDRQEVNRYQIEVSCQAFHGFGYANTLEYCGSKKDSRINTQLYFVNYRYHGDERLLPEYNPSMSDDVTVVSDNDAYSESSSISEEVFPDYFNDLKSDPESKENSKAMYLATLKLNKVRPEQKGVYKCGPSNTRSASVELHITDGT